MRRVAVYHVRAEHFQAVDLLASFGLNTTPGSMHPTRAFLKISPQTSIAALHQMHGIEIARESGINCGLAGETTDFSMSANMACLRLAIQLR
jgi:hypothetical protein